MPFSSGLHDSVDSAGARGYLWKWNKAPSDPQLSLNPHVFQLLNVVISPCVTFGARNGI